MVSKNNKTLLRNALANLPVAAETPQPVGTSQPVSTTGSPVGTPLALSTPPKVVCEVDLQTMQLFVTISGSRDVSWVRHFPARTGVRQTVVGALARMIRTFRIPDSTCTGCLGTLAGKHNNMTSVRLLSTIICNLSVVPNTSTQSDSQASFIALPKSRVACIKGVGKGISTHEFYNGASSSGEAGMTEREKNATRASRKHQCSDNEELPHG